MNNIYTALSGLAALVSVGCNKDIEGTFNDLSSTVHMGAESFNDGNVLPVGSDMYNDLKNRNPSKAVSQARRLESPILFETQPHREVSLNHSSYKHASNLVEAIDHEGHQHYKMFPLAIGGLLGALIGAYIIRRKK